MYVFRDGRYAVRASDLLRALAAQLSSLPAAATGNSWLPALLRAAELECSLADASATRASEVTSELTDWLALRFVGGEAKFDAQRALGELAELPLPETLRLSRPEGFAYYGLHPGDYSQGVGRFIPPASTVAVIGIRTIGTILSAVVCAAVRGHGSRASRTTVRPQGHPFDRETSFSCEQQEWIAGNLQSGAQWLVVDEGPGLSGSSFLSVGEALLRQGVPQEDITFLCALDADPSALRARDAGQRWRSFRSLAVIPSQQKLPDAQKWMGGGEWRKMFFPSESNWPASWTQMERSKFLSRCGQALYKFEGLGDYGEQVKEGAQLLSERGFAPPVLEADPGSGYLAYQFISGRPLSASDMSAAVLERMAQYLAMRVQEFSVSLGAEAEGDVSLETMCRVNFEQEFGIAFEPGLGRLRVERPVIADGRMLRHEWVRSDSGELLKTDGATHGDDHFFPGPCDIAWDLAGAIVEWNLEPAAADFLLSRYTSLTGDHPGGRLGAYRLAYSMFRVGYCKMAAEAMRGTSEESRLEAAYRIYRGVAGRALAQPAAA